MHNEMPLTGNELDKLGTLLSSELEIDEATFKGLISQWLDLKISEVSKEGVA